MKVVRSFPPVVGINYGSAPNTLGSGELCQTTITYSQDLTEL